MNGAVVYAEDEKDTSAPTTSGGHHQKMGMYGSFEGAVAERVLYNGHGEAREALVRPR